VWAVVVGIVAVSAAHAQQANPAATTAKPAAAPHPERALTPIQQVSRAGVGPVPIVLIPDIGFDWTVWKSFMERNGERYTMYAVTLPGIGGTEPAELREGENWEAMALTTNAVKALGRLMDEHAIDRPVLMGHGYGGHLAIMFALDAPARVRSVISVDGLPVQPLGDPNQDDSLIERRRILNDALVPKMLALSEQEWKDRHFINTLGMVADDHRARDLALILSNQDRAVFLYYFFESLQSDLRPRLNGLTVPMLCIAPVTPKPPPPPQVVYMVWEKYLGAPPGTWLTFYPDCYHFVMDDNPAQLDHDVDLFVRGKPIPGARRAATIQVPEPDPDAPVPLPADKSKQKQE
jgi:pimeloyl-ACP methyl ester carboxylesterase